MVVNLSTTSKKKGMPMDNFAFFDPGNKAIHFPSFKKLGFHNNSFVIGPLYKPLWLNVLNLPEHILDACKVELKNQIDSKPGFLLQNSWENILSYLTDTKFYANIELTKQEIKKMDLRRNIDSKKVFPKLYEEVLN